MNDINQQPVARNPATAIAHSIEFLCALGATPDEDSDLRSRALAAAQALEKVQAILRKREINKLRAAVSKPRAVS